MNSDSHLQPSSLEAERALIGAILLDANGVLASVLETNLKAEDFFQEAHAEIYQAIISLYNQSDPVDLVTVAEALTKRKSLEKSGGPAYLSSLHDSIGTAAHAARYAQIVIERSTLRRLISASTVITQECQSTPGNVDELLDRAESSIYKIRDERGSQSLRAMGDLIGDTLTSILRIHENREGISGIPTGYTALDTLTGGFQRSDLIILAGRPSMGKTALGLNLALNAALPSQRQQYKELPPSAVAIFSLEMSTEQLLQRLICQACHFDLGRMRTGRLEPEDRTRLTSAITYLEAAAIYIDDTPAIRVLELRAKARRLKTQLEGRGQRLGLIVVDYLQLMRATDRPDNREQEISEISRSLKSLAKELDVPVLALSQLNRQLETRTDKRPQLSDLRESGAIEQDADIISFVYRPEVYARKALQDSDATIDPDIIGKAELIVGKHRNGPTGTINLHFKAEYSSFMPGDPNY